MLLLKSWKRSHQYRRLASSSDSKTSDVENGEQLALQFPARATTGNLNSSLVLCSIVLIIILFSNLYSASSNSHTHIIHQQESTPSARREWRSLSSEEKLQYISAVQCLRQKPSRIGLNQSLYDDFPWVHSQVGNYSHGTAAFLAWHRHFLATYESALQNDCGYEGQLPYWDWSLDWESLTEAPVWHNTLGFGGNGTATADSDYSLLDGHCVTDGPFADLEVLYIKGKLSRHCLTRGFLEPDSTAMHELRQLVHPNTVLGILLNNSDYASFNLDLEENSHNSIPRIVRGDFSLFTAPYDPVFYLHHAQLDRLWFMWQHLDPTTNRRSEEYNGFTSPNGTVRASPQDLLLMGGLGPDVTVREVLDTRGRGSGSLSYIYI